MRGNLLAVFPPCNRRTRVALRHADEGDLVAEFVHRLKVRGLHDVRLLETWVQARGQRSDRHEVRGQKFYQHCDKVDKSHRFICEKGDLSRWLRDNEHMHAMVFSGLH